MNSFATSDSCYTTADSHSSFASSQASPSHVSSSHRASFLDMSSSHRPTSYPGPAAYAANVYMPGISPPSSPAILPCQRIGWSENEIYTLSSDQLSRIVTGVNQLPTPSQSSSSGSERVEVTFREKPARCCGKISSATGPALHDMFPSLRETVLAAVIKHELEEDELYKLDSDLARRKGRVAFDRYGRGFDAQGTSSEDYPTLQSLIDPLTTYFRILMASCANVYDLQQLADGSQRYISQIVAFADRYDWAAVLAYHFDFYRARMREMKGGQYSGWAQVDAGLHARHLAGREKGYAAARTPSMGGRDRLHSAITSDDGVYTRKKEFCDLFNAGVCASPCRYQLIHQCQGCGSYEHPNSACPTSRVVVYSTKSQAHI